MSARWILLAPALLAACASTPPAAPGRAGVAAADLEPGARRSFEEAVKLWQSSGKAGALDAKGVAARLQAALDADDRLAEAHHGLGVLAELGGRDGEARGHFERALQLRDLPETREALAAMKERQGDVAGARSSYEAIAADFPEHGGARARLAALARTNGDADGAIRLAREALMRDPTSKLAYDVLIDVALDRDQLGVARLLALQALKLDENDVTLRLRAASVLERAGDRKAALAMYRRAAAAGSVAARFRLGQEALENRDFARAREHFEAVLRSEPESAPALSNLGIALRGLGELDLAIAAYDRALRSAPGAAEPLLGKAVILHRHRGDAVRALPLYRAYAGAAAATISPQHPVFEWMKECEQLAQLEAQEGGTPPPAPGSELSGGEELP